MPKFINKEFIEFKCPYCNKNNSEDIDNKFIKNFYVQAIINDKKISDNELILNTPTVKCKTCKIVYHSKWFEKNHAYSIFNSIYGQHHYGWKNYYNFINNKQLIDHGSLYNFISNLKIKKYGEFNCPFSGLFFNFLDKNDLNEIPKGFICKNKSRQLANQKKIQNKKQPKNISNIKKKDIDLYLIKDNSPYCWGDNCISESVNCKSLSQELMGLNIFNLEDFIKSDITFDLFGIFMTLDHTENFAKLLDGCLKKSKFLIIHCHVNPNITKQHSFVLTDEFFEYYSKTNGINIKNITKEIKPNIEGKESYYFLG